MDVSEEWRGTDTARKRRSDVQGKLYNFLNRSAQSLSRSNSQSGRTRRTKEQDIQPKDHDRDITPSPRASHTSNALRLPPTSRNAPEPSHGRHASSGRSPSKSSSPPTTPSLPHKYATSSTTHSKTSTIASPYNTPPQTPSRSRIHSNPSSPSSVRGAAGADLLLTRPLARPITPSNSSSGRKVFGIPIPSPISRKATLEGETEGLAPKRQTHKLRLGSGSSNEPLLHSRHPTNESDRSNVNGTPRPSTSAGTPTPRSTPRTHRSSEDRTPLPTPSSSLPRSHRSATSRDERELPPSPTTPATVSSRRGTPRLDFWRSITPRAPSSQGDRERGKQRATTPSEGGGGGGKDDEDQGQAESGSGLGLVSPQPRALASFLPSIPQLHRTPPTPQRREEIEGQNTTNTNTVRLDSFMSDSMPISQTAFRGGGDTSRSGTGGGLGLTRQPAFKQAESGYPLRQAHTPGPGAERRPTTAPAPALGIQRSNSAPGTRGRLSPCLRIPSPKFLSRERSRSKEHDKEKDKEKDRDKDREKEKSLGYRGEKRRVTPESVGAPILREPRTPYVHPHVHSGEKSGPGPGLAPGQGLGAGLGAGLGLKAPKTSFVQLRRAAHGTFDFERPGSRTSSKSGQSESRDGDEKENVSDKDRDRDRDRTRENEREKEYSRIQGARSPKPPEPIRTKLKASSPIPPLPTPRLLTKPRSPPPHPPPTRTRSPIAASSPTATSHTHTHSQSHTHTQMHVDDSALPRLSSSIARRNSLSTNAHQHQHHRSHAIAHAHAHGYGHTNRTPASLPHFSFEPAAATAPSSTTKPPREVGGQYVDTRTGLIMWAPKTPESESRRSDGGRRGASPSPNVNVNGHVGGTGGGIPQRELEEATVVITQFKNALDDAGFATLQKYVRRYDSKIIPLEGPAGLLTRIQRLLETSAPRVDERRKRELFESFKRVVSKVS